MSSPRSIARASGAVSIATGISRLLGLAREQSIAALFSQGATDAFFAAFRIPNLLRDLLAEGALSSAFLPTYSRLLTRRSAERAISVANSVINALLVVTGLFALSIVVFARGYAVSIASGFSEEKIELTAWLARIMSVFLSTVAVAAVFMAMSNARGRFFVPALAPALFNVGVLAGAWIAAPRLEAAGWPAVTGLAIGAVLGGSMQLLTQIPGVVRDGFRYRFSLRIDDPAVQKIMIRMTPAVFAVAATYVNVLVDSQIASHYGDGAVSYLFFAFRLWMLPIGLFGVAISTANLAGVARDIASGNRDRVQKTLGSSIRLTLLLTVPAACGLMLLREEIVRVVYERGEFTPEMTLATGAVLAMYAVGLPGYALVKVFVPTFYALDDPWTPVKTSAAIVGIKIVLNFALIGIVPRGYPGLALATGIAACLNALWLSKMLGRKLGRIRGEQLGRCAFVVLLATGVMALVLHAASLVFGPIDPGTSEVAGIGRLAVRIGVGMLAVVAVVAWGGLPESRMVKGLVMRVLGRRG